MIGKKEVEAYMTVEISVLFPLIVILLMCVIYITFYSYNRTIAFQNAAITALYGKAGCYWEEEERTERMYTVLNTLNKGQYIAIDKFHQKVSIERNQFIVVQEGNVNIPLFNSEILSKLSFSESVRVRRQDEVFNIRQIRKVKQHGT